MSDDTIVNWPPSTEDWNAVAAALPRVVRVALTKRDVFDAFVETIVTEVEAIDTRLVGPLRAVIDDRRYPELRAFQPVAPPSVADVVRKLDRKSVRTARYAEGAGDVVLMLFGDPADRETCARLAAACREAMQHVTPRSLVQDVATRRGMGAISWSEIDGLVQRDAVSRAEAEGDEGDNGATGGDEATAMPDPATSRALQIDAWRAIAADLIAEARNLVIGLSGMAAGQASPSYADSLGGHAVNLGHQALHGVRVAAEQRIVAKYELKLQVERRRRAALQSAAVAAPAEPSAAVPDVEGYVTIAPRIEQGSKAKELQRGHEHVLGKPIPLVVTPDLAHVERSLMREFPHAETVVRAVLRDMRGKPYVASRPLLLRGAPGCGKSRFARRLGELLGVGVFRVDGSGDAGVSFAGTERRWYSTEPCRPFMACSRFGQANPMILVDEIDKSPVRSDYGRLWDGMLGFLERETAARFQDPSLQVELDLRHVLYVATANDTSRMPGPLLDRFGILIDFPDPDRAHLPTLARHLARELAVSHGHDPRFVEPFAEVELEVMRRNWSGGSVRRLGRIVATVLRARDQRARQLLH